MNTKTPDLEEETKLIKKNIGWATKIITKKPIITLIILIILFLFFSLTIYSLFVNIPFTDKKISIHPINPIPTKCNDSRIYESIFSIDKEGKDWEIDNLYNFKWVLKSNKDFYGGVILYLKPAIESGLYTPIVIIEEDDKSFINNEYIEFGGIISTKNSSKGRYNLCGTIKDNNVETGYISTFCDSRQINIR